jgi:co-chaperonin GroES (HSP10)
MMECAKLPDMDPDLPLPCGYKILCEVPKFEELDETAKRAAALGLSLSKNESRSEEAATVVMRVLALGPEAYVDSKKFPSGPRCRPGDYIVTRSYAGTRLRLVKNDVEYRLLDDESVDAVVSDPTRIRRA